MDEIIRLPDAWVLFFTPLIPIVTALTVKWRVAGQRGPQAMVAIVLSAVLTSVAVLLDAAEDTWGGILGAFMVTFLTQLGIYSGLLSQVGKGENGETGINAVLAPKSGI